MKPGIEVVQRVIDRLFSFMVEIQADTVSGYDVEKSDANACGMAGQVLAESDAMIILESNHYFPPESIKVEFFRSSEEHTTCFWKGVADYYDLQVGGNQNPAAAWFYPDPSRAAQSIRGYIAFWRGVRIEAAPE